MTVKYWPSVWSNQKGGHAVGSLKKFTCGLASTFVVMISLVACTSDETPESISTNTEQQTSASTDAKPDPTFSLPSALLATTDVSADEKLLLEKSSQKMGGTYGPLAVEAKTVVYLRCAGDGTVTFEMKGFDSFPRPCEQDGVAHGTRNVFDTRHVKNATFSVQSSSDQMWSIGIYSKPVP